MTRYRIKEIFGPTLQGEGTYTGTPVLFVRFAGCNRWTGRKGDTEGMCARFCDTDFYGGERLTAEQIVSKLEYLRGPLTRSAVSRVVLSGGEPTIQLDETLVQLLRDAGFELHLETNGSHAIGRLLGLISHITCSPKQAYGETKLERCDDLKMLWPPIAPEITPNAFAEMPRKTLFLQPLMIAGEYDTNLQATITECIGSGARLSLQTHKILGVP